MSSVVGVIDHVLAKVEDVHARPGLGDADGGEFPGDLDGFVAQPHQGPGVPLERRGRTPGAVVESGLAPAGVLVTGVIGLPIVEAAGADRTVRRGSP